jgi:tetratricopeptide (TPR) repeat protein
VAARSRRRLGRVFGLAFGLTLALSSASPAYAQAPSAEGQAEARRSAAKEKFDQGVVAYKAQRYQDAVKLFMEADAMAPSSALSFNVARSFEKLEDISGALRWYRDFLRRSPQASNAVEVRAKVAELAAALSQRGVQQVSVLSEPPGATVLIDDQNVGVTPLTRDVAPGKHRLVLRLVGYAEKSTELRLEPQTPQDVSLQLAPASTARSPDAATSRAGDRQPGDRGPRFGMVPYVVMGAGAAGLLGALGFEISRRSADAAAEEAPQNEFQGRYDTMESRQTTARVLAGVGAALLVTGGVLFFVDRQREPAPRVAVGCDGAGCGLFARGSFQ